MNTDNRYIELNPDLGDDYANYLNYCKEIKRLLSKCIGPDYYLKLSELRFALDPRNPASDASNSFKLRLANSIVLDMLGLGWTIEIKNKKVFVVSPTNGKNSATEAKEMVRKSHLVERDAQLQQDSVREFIRRMETRRLTSTGWHSIFSLMRDGGDLAQKLENLTKAKCEDEKLEVVESVIQPYLQFIDDDPICPYTGLDLRDVWRYYRHTWINAYQPVPGRSMLILVRDAAAPNHPIIGIAALGSSIARQKIRDEWIEWDEEFLLKKIIANPSKRYAKWLLKSLERLISDVYMDDLIAERICNTIDIDYPTEVVIEKLTKAAEKAITDHRLFPQSAVLNKAKNNIIDGETWGTQSKTKLFRSKRCNALASLLKIRHVFQTHGFVDGGETGLVKVLQGEQGRQAIKTLTRRIKAEHVGINMMDIIVCGAVAPYGAILGGKLVCMLMCSPEIVNAYSKKYEKTESIIASSIKGVGVIRNPQLVLLGTTSLYGTNSSQYNRVKIPCEILGGEKNKYIEFKEIGKSEGFGTYHFSETTMELMKVLLGRNKNGRKVNSIFGEGVNPKLRKISDGLGLIKLLPEKLLMHGNSRIVYMVNLAKNFREFLMGFEDKPSYLFSLRDAKKGTEALTRYWYKRWLLNRIENQSVIEKVRNNTLSYPITHEARVKIIKD